MHLKERMLAGLENSFDWDAIWDEQGRYRMNVVIPWREDSF